MALAGASEIIVVNRSIEKGETLAELIDRKTEASAKFVAWSKTYQIPNGTDILVNATSIGLFPNIDSFPNIDYNGLTSDTLVCDVIPNPPETMFLKEAQNKGCKTLNGLGMLVYQGTIGFKMWTGVEASADVMKAALTKAFGSS